MHLLWFLLLHHALSQNHQVTEITLKDLECILHDTWFTTNSTIYEMLYAWLLAWVISGWVICFCSCKMKISAQSSKMNWATGRRCYKGKPLFMFIQPMHINFCIHFCVCIHYQSLLKEGYVNVICVVFSWALIKIKEHEKYEWKMFLMYFHTDIQMFLDHNCVCTKTFFGRHLLVVCWTITSRIQ